MQVPEEMSCFVFILILSSRLRCSCEPGLRLQLLNTIVRYSCHPGVCSKLFTTQFMLTIHSEMLQCLLKTSVTKPYASGGTIVCTNRTVKINLGLKLCLILLKPVYFLLKGFSFLSRDWQYNNFLGGGDFDTSFLSPTVFSNITDKTFSFKRHGWIVWICRRHHLFRRTLLAAANDLQVTLIKGLHMK